MIMRRAGIDCLERTPWWCCVAILAAALAAYHNSFHGPFVFDDASSIVDNPTIRTISGALSTPTTNVTAQGRPVLNFSLALNYAFGGARVEGYHAFNLVIHALAGLTLFGLVRRTLAWWSSMSPSGLEGALRARSRSIGAFPPPQTRDRDTGLHLALTVAILWTVHPLHTESVTYVIQRAESLVGLLYLGTLYCFVRGAQCHSLNDTAAGRAWVAGAVGACLLGMATKEVMATAPLMVLFFDRTFFTGTFSGALRRRPLFYAALAGTWLLLAWLIAQTGGNRGGSVGFGVGVAWWEYWLTQFKAISRYLWLAVWPHPLVFEYGSFWIADFTEIAVGVVLVFALLGATLLALWRRSALGVVGAWFFGILAPTSLAPGTTQMIVEHRMYLPLAAVLVVLGVGIQCLFPRPRVAAAFAAVVALAFIVLTVRRNEDYRSDIALWTDTIAKRPANPLAHFMLGGAHQRVGNITAALASYRRTLELKPDFSIGHEHLGELLLKQGLRADAIAHFEAALRLQPEYPDAHANLGIARLADGRIAEALAHFEKATHLMPDSAITHYNFGNALVAAGLASEAVAQYEAALKIEPAMAEAHFNLANTLGKLERPADAIAHYRAAVKARPNFAAAHYNLANLLARSGRQLEAIGHYEAALSAQPNYPEAHHNLGSAFLELGRLEDAVHHYEQTLRLAPDFPNAREDLQRVRAALKSR